MFRKILKFLPVIMFVGIVLVSIGLAALEAADPTYVVEKDKLDISFDEDGSVNVTESITYDIRKEMNGVMWDIPTTTLQNLTVHEVDIKGAYGNYSLIDNDPYNSIKIYLYADENETVKISDATVTVTASYTMTRVVNLYTDTAELHYKLWGQENVDSVNSIEATIHLPSETVYDYWVNPYFTNEAVKKDGNTLHITTDKIKSSDFCEVRILMPVSDFEGLPEINIVQSMGINKLKQIQTEHEEQEKTTNNVLLVFSILTILCIILPILAYYRHGREPKTGYMGEYERDIPSKHSPAFVNALFESSTFNTGIVSDNAFHATVLDLVNRKYIKLSRDGSGKINLSPSVENGPDKLLPHEENLLSMLRRFSNNGILDLNLMKRKLSNINDAEWYDNNYTNWKLDIKNYYFGNGKMDKYLSRKGMQHMIIFGILGIVISLITVIFGSFSNFPFSVFTKYVGGIGVIGSIIAIAVSFTGNQWTVEGKLLQEKWAAFKRYITDFSMIKEYPPESVAVWNKYIIYATALGCGKKVREDLKSIIPPEYVEVNDVDHYYGYGYYGLFNANRDACTSTLDAKVAREKISSFGSGGGGGFGGVGGGSGGGGRGGF